MYQLRQIIQRMRLGETDRELARTQKVGRNTLARIRETAEEQGWLDPGVPLPDDERLGALLRPAGRDAARVSTVEKYRDEILAWHAQGVHVTTMRAALARNHGFTGSVHALHRFLDRHAPSLVKPTVILEFDVGEMAQIDFGQGPQITDRCTGETFKTWIFVATLAWSRHQYAEFVRDQSVATWLACHRHAFEFWSGVPRTCRIDNLKAAITKACYYEPEVQRSYADLALGYGFRIDPCPVADPAKKAYASYCTLCG
jgi:transposase